MTKLSRSLGLLLIASAVGLSVTTGRGLAEEDEARELGERVLQLYQDYEPRSMLQTPEHPISRARFPVADVHCHWNTGVAPEALVADMDRLGIAYAVNLSGGWGDQLASWWRSPRPADGPWPFPTPRLCRPRWYEMARTSNTSSHSFRTIGSEHEWLGGRAWR